MLFRDNRLTEIKSEENKYKKNNRSSIKTVLSYILYFAAGAGVGEVFFSSMGMPENISGFEGIYLNLFFGGIIGAFIKTLKDKKVNSFNKDEEYEEYRLSSDKTWLELEKAKSHANLLNDIVPSAIFTVDLDCKVISWNRMAEKITGYSSEEIIGKSCSTFAVDPCQNFCGLLSDKVKKPVVGANCKIKSKEGKILHIMKNVEVLRDESGKIIGGIESFIDITERKIFERELFVEKEKAQQYFDTARTILAVIDRDQKIEELNKKGCEVFECSAEWAKGVNFFKTFFPEETWEEWIGAFNQILQGEIGEFEYVESEIISKNGNRKIIAWKNAITKDENGNVINVLTSGEDITEKKKLEEKQALSDEILQRVSSLVVVANPTGEIKYVSPSSRTILGYNPQELLGNGWWEKTNIESKNIDEKKEYISLCAQGKIPLAKEPYTQCIKTKEGEKLCLLWKDSPGPDGDIIGVGQDISGRVDAEKKLALSEKRYRAIIEDQTEFIVRWTPDGRRIFANEAYCRYFNLKNEELFRSSFFQFALDEELQTLLEKIKNLSPKNRLIGPSEFRVKLPSGEIRWNEWTDRGVFDENDNLVEIQSVGRDITDRKFAEEALLKSEERFKSIYLNSSIGIYRTTPEGRVVLCNPALIELMKYPSFEEIAKIHVSEIYVNKSDRDKFLKHFTKNGSVKGFETEWYRYDGEKIFVRINGKAIKDENGKVLVIEGSVEDVTEKKIAEEAMITAKEKAEKSDRLKSEFLSQMSHEIRTPINAIMSFTSLIQDDLEDKVEDDLITGFDIINRAGKRIIRTVDLMLNMADLKAGSYDFVPKEIDLHEEIVLGLFNEYKESAEEKGLSMQISVETNDTTLTGDKYTVNQIFMNLIDNAVKYTREGEINIILSRTETERLSMKVTDTGIGISREYIDALFEPFSQEDQGYARKYEGNGLGLALTKKYCELNNAAIKVESEKGIGTTFEVIFN